MHMDTPGEWGDRDVFQFYPKEFFFDQGLVGSTLVAVNALGPTSSAYLAPVNLVNMHADGYPLCEGREVDSENSPVVLLPNRTTLKEWCSYAARYRAEAYERAWRDDRGSSKGGGWGSSFLMGNKRRNLHCDYLCTYLDELGIGNAFEPCAYDGKHYFTGYYSYGFASVPQRWKNKSGRRHIIVPMNDEGALADAVDLIYGWYDGGSDSVMTESIWREASA